MTRSIVATVLAVLLSCGPALAQDEPKPDPKPKTEEKPPEKAPEKPKETPAAPEKARSPLVERLRVALGLSEEQLAKIAPLEAAAREAGGKLREDAQAGLIDPGEAREKAQELREKTVAGIREVLSPEQRTKFDELIERQRENAGAGGGTEADRARRRLLEGAAKALDDLTPEEKGTVMLLVRKLIDARSVAEAAATKRRAEIQELATKTIEKTELSAKLAAFRAAREADAEKVKQAQAAVRDLLTADHEVKLMALGILD
jgi:Spy/CpxP family protein refolding chaperone